MDRKDGGRLHGQRARAVALGLGLSAGLGLPRGLSGQEVPARPATPAAVRPDSAVAVAAAGLGSRRRVRVRTAAGRRFDGRPVSVTSESLVVVGPLGRRAVAHAAVDSLWVEERSAARAGAWLAGVPCAFVGGLLGGMLASDPDGGGRPGREVGGMLIGGASGGALCGVVGFAVGSAVIRWRLRHVRGAPAT